MPTVIILFVSGLLTILLPCILPLVPIVVGATLTSRHRLQPLVLSIGMVIAFVGSTFLLQIVLSQFITLANVIQIATFYVLLLFGIAFATHDRMLRDGGAAIGSLFFVDFGWVAVFLAALAGIAAMELGGIVATKIQQWGTDIQGKAREGLGTHELVTAFVIGLTMGLVWVPCAGPALGFALTLVRNQPGAEAFVALSAYGIGAAIPVLLIGYGGQAAVGAARGLAKYSGRIKQIAGVILIVSALLFRFTIFQDIQTWLVGNTPFGTWATDLEDRIFGDQMPSSSFQNSSEPEETRRLPRLPVLGSIDDYIELGGTWHNSDALTSEDVKGKIVLIDFWTYSCINCIRTLPYIRSYWDKYKEHPFLLIGVHTPEFVFEKDDGNVANAIDKHALTYPVVQDNDFRIWRAFDNHYWPAKYLIDAEGRVRYTHFGEGAYEETDRAIESLLAEMGVSVSEMPMPEEVEGTGRPRSPEIYLHPRSWSAFKNHPSSQADGVHTFTDASCTTNLHQFCLVGTWELLEGERQVLRSETGQIRMTFLGNEINLVMGMEEGSAPASVSVTVDGEPGKTFTITENDLVHLFAGEYGQHQITIAVEGAGAEAYAFTFGS